MIPLRDWMLVEPYKERETGLALPEMYEDKVSMEEAQAFKVLSVGPGWWEEGEFHQSPVVPGDIVILEGKLSVFPMKFKGKKYFLAQARYTAFKADMKDEPVDKLMGGGD